VSPAETTDPIKVLLGANSSGQRNCTPVDGSANGNGHFGAGIYAVDSYAALASVCKQLVDEAGSIPALHRGPDCSNNNFNHSAVLGMISNRMILNRDFKSSV